MKKSKVVKRPAATYCCEAAATLQVKKLPKEKC